MSRFDRRVGQAIAMERAAGGDDLGFFVVAPHRINQHESALAADLIRGDETVSADELVPTLLSQTGPDLINSLELFEPEYLMIILEQATNHFEKIYSSLADPDEIEKRISLIASIGKNQPTH